MAEKRRLQQDIGKTLGKVEDGINELSEYYKKLESSPTQSQRDKIEENLKKEIKKLKRLRDLLKGWIASQDIKDKDSLEKARKRIEEETKKYKSLEHQSKMKAFSNEGLYSKRKSDHDEEGKQSQRHWISSSILRLSNDLNMFENESKEVSLKKGKYKVDRMSSLIKWVQYHNTILQGLEKVLRFMDSDVTLPPLDSLKEAFEGYISTREDAKYQAIEAAFQSFNVDAPQQQDVIIVPLNSVVPSGNVKYNEASASEDSSGLDEDSKSSNDLSMGHFEEAEDPVIAARTITGNLHPPQGGSEGGAFPTASHSASSGVTRPHPPEAASSAFNSSSSSSRVLEHLKVAHTHRPTKSDADRYRFHIPKISWTQPQDIFPQYPLADFDSPAFFEKLNADTLFFIFYYQQGTYQQYLAAKQLKHQTWRYHKQFYTWFRRHEEPVLGNDTLEQGNFIYFDYDKEWGPEIKKDFTFEYRWLEDELPR